MEADGDAAADAAADAGADRRNRRAITARMKRTRRRCSNCAADAATAGHKTLGKPQVPKAPLLQ